MRFARYALISALAFFTPISTGNGELSSYRGNESYEIVSVERELFFGTDERSDLIARMKKTMASQDDQVIDFRPRRDRIISTNECALLLDDLGFKDEYAYDSGAVSVGPEKNGSDINIWINVGNLSSPKTITLEDAKKYLKKREKK